MTRSLYRNPTVDAAEYARFPQASHGFQITKRPPQRIEIAFCDPAGLRQTRSCLYPDHAPFRDAFNAFAHGTLFAGVEGPVAVEDIWPGDQLLLNNTPAKVTWIAKTTSRTVHHHGAEHPTQLSRIATQILTPGSIFPDLILGPAGRVFKSNRDAHKDVQTDGKFFPPLNIFDTDVAMAIQPQTSIDIYHIQMESHGVLMANGIKVESFHPGPEVQFGLAVSQQQMYLDLFPHLTSIDDFGHQSAPRRAPR